MATFPHSRLHIGQDLAVVISGPHLQVVQTQTGHIQHATAQLESLEREALLKSGPIRCSAVDASFKHAVTCGEDKLLKVWQIDGLKLLSSRELPKRPTDIQFTRDGQTILVSDKFGDIFSYHLYPELVQQDTSAPSTSKQNVTMSHENPSNGTLVLGHTSLLTTFFLTKDEKYVVSADRDEHIRISWYPQGYVIERFCLGHKKYVSAIHTLSFSPSMLLSGGGDSIMKLWDWMSGELLADVPIEETISPFIVVKAPKRKRGWSEDGEDEQPKADKLGRRRGKGRRRGAKKAGDETTAVAEDEAQNSCEEAPEPETEVSTTRVEEQPANEEQDEAETDQLVLALQRIDSVELPGQGQFFLFSAVGATALFYCHFPSSPSSQSEWPIKLLDLGKPIIDFIIDQDGFVWILVDGEHSSGFDKDDTVDDKRIARLAKWLNGKLVEVLESADVPPLLTSLNTSCRLPATAADLKSLDLYSPLLSLPKSVDPEHDPMRKGALDDLTPLEDPSSRQGTPGLGTKPGKTREPTQRELARIKNKKAVLARVQENERAKASRKADPVAPEDERDSKKAKPDDTPQANAEDTDVKMSESA